jgi:hypothetical protein
MATVANLLVKLGAQTSDFDKKMRGSTTTLKKVGTAATGVSVAVVAALGVMVKKAVDVGDNFHKMSLRTGESVENLSALKFAAERSGSSIDTLETGIIKLAKNMNDMNGGTGEARDSFIRLGIKVNDASGNLRSGTAVMLDVAEALKTVESDTEKAALAAEIFGRSAGPQLLPLLKEGSAGIQELMDKARELGGVMGTDDAEAAAAAADAITDMSTALGGITRIIATSFLPGLTKIVTGTATLIGKFIEWKNKSDLVKESLASISRELSFQSLTKRYNAVKESIDQVISDMARLKDMVAKADDVDSAANATLERRRARLAELRAGLGRILAAMQALNGPIADQNRLTEMAATIAANYADSLRLVTMAGFDTPVSYTHLTLPTIYSV